MVTAESRRKACHMCGNMRKVMQTCPNCPHVYCFNCAKKARDEFQLANFENGCPVCLTICCCANKTIACTVVNHCYRKCPGQKNLKLASDALQLVRDTMQFCETYFPEEPCETAMDQSVPETLHYVPVTKQPPRTRAPRPGSHHAKKPVVKKSPYRHPERNCLSRCTCSYGVHVAQRAAEASSGASQSEGVSFTQSSSLRQHSPNDAFLFGDSIYWDEGDDNDELRYMEMTPHASSLMHIPLSNESEYPLWEGVWREDDHDEDEQIEFTSAP